MNLYLIKRKDKHDYDEYDSAVVVAASSYQAKHIHPHMDMNPDYHINKKWWEDSETRVMWTDPSNVQVTQIGQANPIFVRAQVICASFNAG